MRGTRTTGRDTALLAALLAVTGIALGAGGYEARVVIPRWASRPTPEEVGPALESSGHLVSGRVFWPTVGVPIVPLAAANVVAALRSEGPRRPWWLAFSTTIAAGCVATATYYVPALRRLARAESLPEARVRAQVSRRVRLDNLRLAVVAAAWLAGLKALSRPRTTEGESTR
jgi:Na+/melibiose symporter-like transporter